MSDDGKYSGIGSAPEARSAIVTSALVRRYGETVALRGIDIEVQTGEVYGFLGPNGAGKSTLIRILCTLAHPTSGQALVAGYDVVTHPREVRMRIGCALQAAALDDKQTGRELLALQARLYGFRRRQIRPRVDEVLDLVAIGHAIDRRIGTYSGGMKRRVDLAAALVHDPEVLFLDEPTTGLDPDSRERVWEEVARLNRQLGKTIFLTTQYLEEADVLADRVGIISQGLLVAEGPPSVLKRSVGSDVIEVEVRGTDPSALDRLAGIPGVDGLVAEDGRLVIHTADAGAVLGPLALELHELGAHVANVEVRSPSLDDVFRAMTRTPAEDAPSLVGPAR